MKPSVCLAPLPLESLVDYTAGDLTQEDEQRLEEHYFGCEACARRLASVEALGQGVRDLVRGGKTRASVTLDVVERIARQGLGVRRYVLAPGETVQCTAAPEDDFVLVELEAGAALQGGAQVEVLTEDLAAGGAERRLLLAAIDRARGSILLLFPAHAVRAFPRSRWTMHVTFEADPSTRLGAYVMEHTPWQELEG